MQLYDIIDYQKNNNRYKIYNMKKYEKICPVLGVNVAVTNMDKTISFLTEDTDSLKGQYICVSNSHTVVTAHDDDDYMNVQNSAAMILPDGKPLSVVQRKKGFSEAEKVSGPDVFSILTSEKYNSFSHFFYGSTEDTLKALKSNLTEKNAGINIAGMYSPPFRPLTEEEDEAIIKMINDSNADFIWVGLGAPKQEIWMYNHKNKLNGVMLGVGAAFDFHAGMVKRAPLFMQKAGLEWLYRLTQDPKRLFKRYLITNTKFIFYNLFNR